MRSTGLSIAFCVGSAALLVPLWISTHLAWRQSLEGEKSLALSYASDVLRRAELAGNQLAFANLELSRDRLRPCSREEIKLMGAIAIGSSYLQGVGRISGDNLICTSLGTTEQIPIGSPDYISSNGVAFRDHRHLTIAPVASLDVVSVDNIAGLVDPALVVDTPTEGPEVAMEVFAPSTPARFSIASRGSKLKTEWLKAIPPGTTASFIDGDYVVSETRSQKRDLAVVAAIPTAYASRRVFIYALFFVPIGLVCGAGLVWAVTYVARIRLSLPAVLRVAARRREFYVEYQPIVELASRRWVGAEALVRWKRGGGIVRPDQFIPVAEESGVITFITERVAELVAAHLPQIAKLDAGFRISINVSAADLSTDRILETFSRLLKTSGCDAKNIYIEATERGFLQGSKASELLARIRSMGIGVAIDDFGTGYSSLACLQTLGLDVLKIDKAFVDTIGTDGATSQVVVHIIEMAHSLHLEMVAEGVETEEQAEFLQQRGVRFGQGWQFGRPMAVQALCDEIAARKAAMAPELVK